MDNWFCKNGEPTQNGSAALVGAGVFLVGCWIFHLWTSDVEDALKARLKHLRGLKAHIESIECDVPTEGRVYCDVEFVDETRLSTTRVLLAEIAPRPNRFPAKFEVFRRAGELQVKTPFEGKSMDFEAGVLALQSTLDSATLAAEAKLGPQMREGFNALTYSDALKNPSDPKVLAEMKKAKADAMASPPGQVTSPAQIKGQ